MKYSPTGCSASKSNYPTDVPLYQESRCRIRAMRSRGYRGSARIASESYKTPWIKPGQVQRSGPLDLDALAFLNDHDSGPRVSLLGICWPERSNGSTRCPQPPSNADSQMPPIQMHAILPESLLPFPESFIARLLHANAARVRGCYF
jgi:hypothetical protein